MRGWLSRLRETARLMVGQPSYEAYLAHMAAHHPERAAMTRTEYFRDREQARYRAKGGGRCC
jgi:uncharacterized short protein YbdD (DUF466 family)